MATLVTKENVTQEVTESKLPIVIDVYASWCGPCQQMSPIFDQLQKEFEGKCKFLKLNVDESRELSIQYGVTSVPTFIFVKNGAIKLKETGYMSKEDLRKRIEEFL